MQGGDEGREEKRRMTYGRGGGGVRKKEREREWLDFSRPRFMDKEGRIGTQPIM